MAALASQLQKSESLCLQVYPPALLIHHAEENLHPEPSEASTSPWFPAPSQGVAAHHRATTRARVVEENVSHPWPNFVILPAAGAQQLVPGLSLTSILAWLQA
jgi:hypothetical protein